MPLENTPQIKKIGVFYDGNFFLHVSNYYYYVHERKSRISVRGLHEFIRHQVAQEENVEYKLCQIVDAHYFRGRLTAREAVLKGNQLYYDRLFEDILMNEGVTTHFLPVKSTQTTRQEKGIDVWLALEVFELSLYKKFNVVVLIASDGDYVPLVRKLNTLGIKVMVLSWDFEYTDDYGHPRLTRTSQELLEEVSYPVAMHEIIENRLKKNEPLINNLFVPKSREEKRPDTVRNDIKESTILSLKNGYGFIKYPPNNIFFTYQGLIDVDFNDLVPGDKVEFRTDKNDSGELIAINIRLIEKADPSNIFNLG